MNDHDIWTCSYINQIIDAMADGVFTINPDGKIMSWNKSMERITGYTNEEAKGRDCTFIHFSSCLDGSCPGGIKDCGILNSTTAFSRECVLLSKFNEEIPVLKRARILLDDNKKISAIVETVTDLRELKQARQKAVDAQNQLAIKTRLKNNIIGISPAIEDLVSKIKMASLSDANILIEGETGTGKELCANAIHFLGRRKDFPFVALNCSALPETLLESELFGHVKGSFTGAFKDRKGRFEEAENGTLFLDEIGEIPVSVQVKLLRAVQEREIERIGSSKKIKTNIRIIAATNKNLSELVKKNKFREDLYYRLKVFPITIPPLRERKEDIPLLLDFFVKKSSKETKKHIIKADKKSVKALMDYDWPGNVRELENAVSYAFVVAGQEILKKEDFPPETIDKFQKEKLPFIKNQKKQLERQNLVSLLEQCNWNKAEAGRKAGLSRTTIWKYMKKWDIPLNQQLTKN
ncbi:MAG: sigma-54-dependent Fis family transcriptional regulator [Desulforegulaceae bacterium]|nr:sigma-54-dependent Fis family transcriptional regulator [Desulforegulaceae bacterium]